MAGGNCGTGTFAGCVQFGFMFRSLADVLEFDFRVLLGHFAMEMGRRILLTLRECVIA